MGSLARRAGIAIARRSACISARSYSSIDRDIEEFNQELEEMFGAPPAAAGAQGFPARDPSSQSIAAPSIARDRSSSLTHFDSSGKASMVDVSHKMDTKRNAVASGRVLLGPDVFHLVAANKIAKGDVLTVAKIAGIQAAKQTATLIPLCHTIALSSVDVMMALDEEASCVEVTAEASSVGPTGVEMEALTAVSVACLTVYDMCKAASKAIQISGIELVSKSGGKSGDWHREKN
ncbi:uncharacterized protein LOC9655413 [Selaginella moellendorffii]|nr:uncharacterized protein LOC9655413 [Selaginella moellendorffii]XP_024526273.1 uncharacterized protein LOC9655413 [Selaginella moellendorffii]|eukprot:XP_002965500.2 uncharacterized protein LOC9655413 [Selaginella moellendorffii]